MGNPTWLSNSLHNIYISQKKLAKILNSICWTKLVENKKQNRKRIIDTVHGIGNPIPNIIEYTEKDEV